MPETTIPPCKPGSHLPAIVHRTGGRDARYWNRCAKCGREIKRADGEPWATSEQVEEYANQMHAEARQEMERG